VYAEERQSQVLELARAEGRVEVGALSERFAVTPETVRRDLTALERRGLLRRVHGGAIPVERLGFEPPVADRQSVLAGEKERIAKAALAEVPVEGAVLLDAGTTTLQLAEALPSDRELTVVTNGPQAALLLAARPNLTVHLVGGRLRSRTLAVVDDAATAFLQDLFVDVAFVGTNGLSVARGLTTSDRAEAATKAAMIRAARRTVVLADHTKIGADGFVRFGRLEDVDVVITDSGLAEELADEVEAAGPRVVRA
jgi:DeoR family fructose operon transcriptional repressor